jgi:exonuclease SbcC
LKNFGPYREKAEVDFSRLGEFFLICGKTGSGKSTLFDAITYALFGQAPGSRKGSEGELASDFALPGEKPEVEFEFFLSGQKYRVARNPPYAKPKRAGGLTEVPSAAALWTEAQGAWKPLADGVAAVNKALSERVGLSADEFSKIILLPQGEFQEFLEMDSTRKGQILEKLFPVKYHEVVAQLAKERAAAAALELSYLSAEIGRRQAELGEEPQARAAAARELLAAKRAEEAKAQAALEGAQAVLEAQAARVRRAEAALAAQAEAAALESVVPQEEARAAKIQVAKAAAKVRPIEDNYLRQAAAAKDLEARVGALSMELESLLSREEEIQGLRQHIQALEAELGSKREGIFALEKASAAWSRRLEAAGALKKAEARARELETAFSAEESSIRSRREALENAKRELEDEGQARAALEISRARLSGLSALADRLDRAAKLGMERAKAQKDHDMAQAALAEALEARQDAARALKRREEALSFLEAGKLASSLVEGKPCPVCGSVKHPSPALGAQGSAEAEQEAGQGRAALVEAEAGFARAGANLEHALSRLGELDAALDESIREISPAAEELSFGRIAVGRIVVGRIAVGEFASAVREVSQAKESEAGNFKALAARLAGFEAARKAIRADEEALEAAGPELESLRAALEGARVEKGRLGAVVQEALLQSGETDPAPALEEFKRQASHAETEKAKATALCSRWDEAAAAAKSSLGTLRQESAASRQALAADLAALEAALQEKGFYTHPDLAQSLANLHAASMPDRVLAEEEAAAALYRESLAAARAKAASLAQDLPPQGQAMPDIEALRESAARSKAALAEARGATDALQLEVNRLETGLAALRELTARRRDQEEGSRSLAALSELLRGEIAGRRLPFKFFVLAMYFAEVVRRASIHLASMSDGRYYLEPEDGQSSGRGRVGLGLRVLDSWTGQGRPTATLSGGEKFLTAISLALGLADSIRERRGGISLDAVFIDEGFGSLDDEALDRAIGVLDRIRGARVIGIVSHVAGLENRIPSRIQVEKTASGSNLRILGAS